MTENPKPWFDVGVAEATKRRLFALFGFDEKGPPADARLLDFGCGAGRYMKIFAEVFGTEQVYGVDVDSDRFGELKALGFSCKKLEDGEARLNFPDRHFRYVYSSNVIEHIPRRHYLRYLEEIHRVLEPQGVLVIGAPNYPFKRLYDMRTAWRNRANPEMRNYYLFDDPTHVNFVNVLGVEKDLKRVGFRELSFEAASLPFLDTLPMFRKRAAKRRFRALGYKFIGSCRKAEAVAGGDTPEEAAHEA